MILLLLLNDTAPTAIYTLSLHDALPIWARLDRDRQATRARRVDDVERRGGREMHDVHARRTPLHQPDHQRDRDRKSKRLNSSNMSTSYAAFCLKKKK